MGDYLSTPIKTKEVMDGETQRVNLLLNSSLNMPAAKCKDGAKIWKTLIYAWLI